MDLYADYDIVFSDYGLMAGNRQGSGRHTFYPARDGRMNRHQVEAAVGDSKVWKTSQVNNAPDILRREGLWTGPDWNTGEWIIETEPWEDDSGGKPPDRYVMNPAGDGLVFNMDGPRLDPPRGMHNPHAAWAEDLGRPADEPASGVGFVMKRNPDAWAYNETLWMDTADAEALIAAMTHHAHRRRERWARDEAERDHSPQVQIARHRVRIGDMEKALRKAQASSDAAAISAHLELRIESEKHDLALALSETDGGGEPPPDHHVFRHVFRAEEDDGDVSSRHVTFVNAHPPYWRCHPLVQPGFARQGGGPSLVVVDRPGHRVLKAWPVLTEHGHLAVLKINGLDVSRMEPVGDQGRYELELSEADMDELLT